MFRGTGAIFVGWLLAACAKPLDTGVVLTPSTVSAADPSVCERLLACAREPRVLAGEVDASGCAAIDWISGRVGALGPGEAPPQESSPVLLGARPSSALTSTCVARLERSVVPRLARLPLESFRRDRTGSGPDCRF